MERIKMLVIDDEEHNLFGIKATYRKEIDVLTASNTIEAERILQENQNVSIILCDQKMPQTSGLQFLSEVKVKYPKIIRLLYTAYTDNEVLLKAINEANVFKFILKPVNMEELNKIIEEAHKVYVVREESESMTRKIIQYNEDMKSMLTTILQKTEIN